MKLFEILSCIHDPRQASGKRYPLANLLALVCLGLLCGQTSYSGIAQWFRALPGDFHVTLGFKPEKTPCKNTLRNILACVALPDFLQCLRPWSPQPTSLLAIDGKTLRGSRKKGVPECHLLSAVSHELCQVYGQCAVPGKGNELTVIEEFLKQVVKPGQIVTLDAMFTQVEVSKTILALQADYILAAKGNQEDLEESLGSILKLEAAYGEGIRQAYTCDKGHGRIEERCLKLAKVPAGLVNWPGIQQAFLLQRKTFRDGKQTQESVLGLTSLKSVEPHQLLEWIRNHWTIENRLHWVKDVLLAEDKALIATQSTAHAMAALRSTLVSLMYASGYTSLSHAIRCFCAQPARALNLLGWTSEN